MSRQIVVDILGDASQFTKATNTATKSASKFSNVLTGIGQGAGIAGFMGVTSVADKAASAVVGFTEDSIQAASRLQESQSKSNVIFGESSTAINNWAKTADRSMGLSQRAALDAASGFAGLFKVVGFGMDQATGMSQELTQLGSDLASFFDTDMDTALNALKSGLNGESEPLRQFNVFLSETAVNAKLAQMGVKKVGGQFTEQQKALARYKLILEQTGDAQGDFARTSDGLANSSRTLDAKLENLQARIGTGLTPAVEKGTGMLIAFMDALDSDAPIAAQDRLKGLTDVMGVLNPATWGMSGAFDAFGEAQRKEAKTAEEAAYATASSWDTGSERIGMALDQVETHTETTSQHVRKDVKAMRRTYAEMADYLLGKFTDDFGKAMGIIEGRERLHNAKSDKEIVEAYANLAEYQTLNDESYGNWIAALKRLARGTKGQVHDAYMAAIADIKRLRANAAAAITVRVNYAGPSTVGANDDRHASGYVGTTSGPTMTGVGWMGEAGTEAYAILRNPKPIKGDVGGGGVTINISTPLLTPGSAESLVAAIGPYLTRSLQRTGMIPR